jgi:hypothetical protein
MSDETSNEKNTPAVKGTNTAGGTGVHGVGQLGVHAQGDQFHGVFGSTNGERSAGVFGTTNQPFGFGVQGHNPAGDGVLGKGRRGVVGESETFQGVFGKSRDNAGVVGDADKFHGVVGISHDRNSGGIFGSNDGGGFAGVFDGKVAVSG